LPALGFQKVRCSLYLSERAEVLKKDLDC